MGTRRKSRRPIRPASYREMLFRTMKSPPPSLYTATPRSLFDPQSNSIPRNRPVDTAAKIISTCYLIIQSCSTCNIVTTLPSTSLGLGVFSVLFSIVFASLSPLISIVYAILQLVAGTNFTESGRRLFSVVSCSCSFTLFMNQTKFLSSQGTALFRTTYFWCLTCSSRAHKPPSGITPKNPFIGIWTYVGVYIKTSSWRELDGAYTRILKRSAV